MIQIVIFKKGATVFGRKPLYHDPFSGMPKKHSGSVQHHTSLPFHQRKPIRGLIPSHRHNVPIVNKQNPGYNTNIEAIKRNRKQEAVNKTNYARNQRLLSQQLKDQTKRSKDDRDRSAKQMHDQQERNRQQQIRNQQQKQNIIEQQRRFREPQQRNKDVFARSFYDLETRLRNIQPWQVGVAVGATALIAGIGLVEGVAIGVTRGLFFLSARMAAALGITGSVLNKIPEGKNRDIMDRAIQIGRDLPTFLDKIGALKQAVQSVVGEPNIVMKVDFVKQIAYGGKGGYGIAIIEDITYVVKIDNDKIVEVLGRFR